MFTGIVTHLGEVKRAARRNGAMHLKVHSPLARELKVGESIAVNGVCLTATAVSRRVFDAHVMGETLDHSTLGGMKRSQRVNLELPARLVDRLGGHLVQGHVDGVAGVVRIADDDTARRVWFEAGRDVLAYMVHKGSVALDGVSLTLAEVGTSTFQVALIPHTLKATTLADLKVGSIVNVEVDVIAKYVARLMERN